MAKPHIDGPARSNVAVIGTGYVGLTAGACLAHIGCNVVCADVDADKVERLQRGDVPIVEEGLEELVSAATQAGTLRFVVGSAEAVREATVVMLCLPTPQDDDGSADLSYVERVATEIGPLLQPGAMVVNKSTVPVGATKIVEHCLGRNDIAVLSNPEFLSEGNAVRDFLNPDRIVIGGSDQDALKRLAALYEPLDAPVLLTDAASAETIKYAANGFLALKLSFVNSVAALCDAVGADVGAVVEGIGADHRIGPEFLRPGPGWGGSCFPKDSRALIAIASQHGYDFSMMRNTIAVNQEQRERMVRKVAHALECGVGGYRPLAGKRIGALGLTYKAGTDDMRESPAIAIVERLVDLGAEVAVYDPTTAGDLDPVQRARLGELEPSASAVEALGGVDVAVILTEWPEFEELDLGRAATEMRGDVIVDTRNILDPVSVRAAGLQYIGVGRR